MGWALISVHDKTGVVELAQRLRKAGFEIVSTGGTAAQLRHGGVPVTGVSELTGFPEILDGRVKTLHPKIHGALLARRESDAHMASLSEHGIQPVDIVVVNLYPFRKTVGRPDVTLEEALENIDIGGPAMIRSAAKNHKDVIVLVNPSRYEEVLRYIEAGEDVPYDLRLELALEAFRHTSAYDALISEYLGRITPGAEPFPQDLVLGYDKRLALRYGENPHQQAALYTDPLFAGPSVVSAEQLHGKELSYNNISDADAALSLVLEFAEPCAVAVKHANPCGVAVAPTIEEAYARAYEADPVSIFGGIVAINRAPDAKTATAMSKIFLEIVIAPGYDPEALAILSKKRDLRILKYSGKASHRLLELKTVTGGLLVQDRDTLPLSGEPWKAVTERQPTEEEMSDLRFGWRVVKYVKSNAIVLAKGGRTLGIGAGQPNRIDSAKIAIAKAGDGAEGAVMTSDAFFAFPDVVEAASAAGVTAIVQPGGSIKDRESIEAADKVKIAMVFTGTRHFRH